MRGRGRSLRIIHGERMEEFGEKVVGRVLSGADGLRQPLGSG